MHLWPETLGGICGFSRCFGRQGITRTQCKGRFPVIVTAWISSNKSSSQFQSDPPLPLQLFPVILYKGAAMIWLQHQRFFPNKRPRVMHGKHHLENVFSLFNIIECGMWHTPKLNTWTLNRKLFRKLSKSILLYCNPCKLCYSSKLNYYVLTQRLIIYCLFYCLRA